MGVGAGLKVLVPNQENLEVLEEERAVDARLWDGRIVSSLPQSIEALSLSGEGTMPILIGAELPANRFPNVVFLLVFDSIRLFVSEVEVSCRLVHVGTRFAIDFALDCKDARWFGVRATEVVGIVNAVFLHRSRKVLVEENAVISSSSSSPSLSSGHVGDGDDLAVKAETGARMMSSKPLRSKPGGYCRSEPVTA